MFQILQFFGLLKIWASNWASKWMYFSIITGALENLDAQLGVQTLRLLQFPADALHAALIVGVRDLDAHSLISL